MKDYYKILGLKENTSEEEIRARWIKLTKHYHPDLRGDNSSDKKIKEINEAYQVLKHSSTRVEYDLKRTYGQKKRRFYLNRISIPISIFIVLIILGTIYIKTSQTPSHSKPAVQDQIDSTTQRPKDAIKAVDLVNQTRQTDSTTRKPYKKTDQIVDQSTTPPPPPTPPFSNESEFKSKEEPSPPTILKSDISMRDDKTVPKEINEAIINKIQKGGESRQDAQIIFTPLENPRIYAGDDINIKPQSPIESGVKALSFQTGLIPSQIDPPSTPIVKEREVEHFLANYIERYTKKDLGGFLSLFSSGATHNNKDRLDKIRTIYANFFDQCQEIRYYMEDIRIDIYQNPVEVKTRYEVVQILKKGGEKIWRGEIKWALVKEQGGLKILSLDYKHHNAP